MSKEHWVLLAGFVAILAVQIGTLKHWNEAVTPQFLAGTLGQVALLVRGFFTEKPEPK